MQTFIRGNKEEGNAVLLSLLLILVLSLLFLSFMPRVIAVSKYASDYKAQVLESIENTNKEVIKKYDLY